MKPLLPPWSFDDSSFQAGIAETSEEILALARLRAEYYAKWEKDYIVDGREHDEYDDRAVHFMAVRRKHDSEQLIGCMRLVRSSKNLSKLGFPVESGQYGDFRIQRLPSGVMGCASGVIGDSVAMRPLVHPVTYEEVPIEQTVEASRWIGLPRQLSDGRAVMVSMLLVETAIEYCLQNGFRFWIGVQQESLFQQLKKNGWPVYPVIPGLHPYRGSKLKYRVVLFGLRHPCVRTVHIGDAS
ncbi:MAG: GNAT family N-acyltransferase [bacterium]